MLIRYKKNMEKIAMGLLSFMPTVKDIKTLQQIIEEYDTNPNWHLHLWKAEDDMIGVIGLQVDDELKAVIQHVAVSPSHRNQGIGKKMVAEINQQYHQYQICAEKEINDFYNKCCDDAD